MRDADGSRVLMIGLDAAESELIERWTGDGTLPALARLRARGCYTRLGSSAEWLVGSPWPTFYTGTTPADHGMYHYVQWRAETMRTERPDPSWLPLRPFWREVSGPGRRAVAVDVPMSYGAGDFEGVEVGGWASHDLLKPPYVSPRGLRGWVEAEIGPPAMSEELHHLVTPRQFLALRDEMIGHTRRITKLSLRLMEREEWRLFIAVFGATHRGGHRLWGLTGLDREPTGEERRACEEALRRVYVAVDEAVGELVEAAGEGVNVMAFAVHGMGPNTCRAELMSEMVERVLRGREGDGGVSGGGGGGGVLRRVREAVPRRWRSALKRRLPTGAQDWLTGFWRTGNVDWSVTRAVAPVADSQGYVRVNLRGREARGVVEPGAEYEAVLAQLTEGLMGFVDADTGRPIVKRVTRVREVYPAGERLDHLPDLLVHWSDEPSAGHRAVRSARHGEIAWPTPGKNQDGRSGNHRGRGWLIGAGPAFEGASLPGDAHVLDLAPTACRLIGAEVPAGMRGRPLVEGVGAGV